MDTEIPVDEILDAMYSRPTLPENIVYAQETQPQYNMELPNTEVTTIEELLDKYIDKNGEEIQDEEIEEIQDLQTEEIESEEIAQETKEQETKEQETIGEKRNPVFRVFGKQLDQDSVFVSIVILVIWLFIWRYTGLWKTLRHDVTFAFVFVSFILYVFANTITAGTTSGGVVYELNILLTVEQMISILFGTVVLFTLFSKNLPLGDNCRKVVLRISISAIIILTFASMWISVWTSGRAFRAIRKFKQGVYNITLSLFVLIGMIFFHQDLPCGTEF